MPSNAKNPIKADIALDGSGTGNTLDPVPDALAKNGTLAVPNSSTTVPCSLITIDEISRSIGVPRSDGNPVTVVLRTLQYVSAVGKPKSCWCILMTIQKVLFYFIKCLSLSGCSFKSEGQHGNETNGVFMTQKK